MNILFLYTELADYTTACLRELKRINSKINVMVVHYPVNPEAPFKFDFENIGVFKSVNTYPDKNSFLADVKNFNPDKIIVSGWINKWYVSVCRLYRSSAITVLTMDNHYKATLKQQLFKLIFPLYLKPNFKYCWVPGPPQEEYALKLGFNKHQVFQGFYCCNQNKFDSYFSEFKEIKGSKFPKRFLCVARYVPQKNYDRLWQAFIQWQDSNPNEWELWCAGTGEGYESRVIHPKIKHLGFVQTNEWSDIIKETGVFTLASLDEPWGVAVHEFACAGFPLLISSKIGAASIFFQNNGQAFDPENESEIIKGFEYFDKLTQDELSELMINSVKNSKKITLRKWAETVTNSFN